LTSTRARTTLQPGRRLNILSWNIAHRPRLWNAVVDAEADIALLQEACEPPPDVAKRVGLDPEPWRTDGAGVRRPWRAAIAQINPSIDLTRHSTRSICDANPGELAVSRLGSLAAADVRLPETGETITLISMYAVWENVHLSTRRSKSRGWIFADASVHRLISDLSVFIPREGGHRILASGDLNILYGYGEEGSEYWAARYKTIFDRFEALGLRFVGPRFPFGRQADPWPEELPHRSQNVPTYHTTHQTCAAAARQLDFVFASAAIAERVTVRALNTPEEWGESDHCRLKIVIASPQARGIN
jgi:hypothetical protein